ncbi:hypothetical protein [Streptomyces sp. NPDC057199]|uniref:hypothetical protein n=1 Tax=Streptomyces sp. NPDC057199 TaxID=3346047 RepID=UPI00362EC823
MAGADAEGQFVCHSIDEKNTTLDIDSDTARLVIQTITDATVYGTQADWPLRLATDYVRRAGTWAALRTVATAW